MITREEALRKIQAFIDFCPAIKTEMEETVEALSVPQWIKVEVDLPCNHNDLVLTYNGIPFSTKRVLVMTDVHTLFLCEMKKMLAMENRGVELFKGYKDLINETFPKDVLNDEQGY